MDHELSSVLKDKEIRTLGSDGNKHTADKSENIIGADSDSSQQNDNELKALYQELEIWYPLLRFKEENAEVVVVGSGSADQHKSKLGYPVKVDAFAKDATLFERAYSPGSWTRPSVASIFTGVYPPKHSATGREGFLDEKIPTIAKKIRK